MNSKQEFIEDNLIIISKQTSDLFLKQENPADILALYWFYYYTAKWQKTNQPKCSTNYVAKGLNWSLEKVRQTKKVLIKLELIQNIKQISKEGKITGWYIRINYIWKKETIKNHTTDNPQCGSTHSVANPEGNALNANKLNALNNNSLNSVGKADGNKINLLIEKFKSVNPSYERLFKNTTQRAVLERMSKKYGFEKLGRMINALPEIVNQKFAPTITTPLALEDKLGNLLAFISKNNKKKGGVHKV